MTGPGLAERFLGCIAASRIGGAMAAPVAGLPWPEVQRRHGLIDRFLPRDREQRGGQLGPGSTDENGERQKLILRAVARKGGRIIAQDIRDAWLEHLDVGSASHLLFSYDADLLRMAEAGVPADEIGAFCDHSRVAGFAASCQPIGLINAGDVVAAAADASRCGRLYQKADSGGIKWAAAVAVAVAAACRPGADVDAVGSCVIGYTKRTTDGWFDLTTEIQRALDLASRCRDFQELRSAFDSRYSRIGLPFAMSLCNEVVPKALAVVALTRGRVRDTLVASVNMGRDAASVAAIACGIAGALRGPADLPANLMDELDEATRRNPHSSLRQTIREEAADLLAAYDRRLARMLELVRGAEMQAGEP